MRSTYEMPRRPDHRERLTPAQVARKWGYPSLDLVLRAVAPGEDFAVMDAGVLVPCTLVLEYELEEASDA